ncbi:alcohol dehydrogenase [Sphingomonas sp. LH128]|uniref:PQQ-dependent dehydrogenase, methanol/ethanol family n=1 Tax=Sphingomonas sp. LH128 TaxID=473781 RepID=UPI00027CC2A0|nr:PQQ-dependent dehydrogenase, methanol/ethanol family [Sphingomonas sp. LH128]EJU11949.1 alcohol dehydrogenase [Sphingomonas sp. LH128]
MARSQIKTMAAGSAILGAALLALAGCQGGTGGQDPKADGAMLADPDNWPNYGRTPGQQQYSPLDQINADTVGDLKLAWHYDLQPGFSVSEPIEVDGKLFVTTGHAYITALDATTGKVLWEYDSKTRERATSALHMGWGNKGLAYYKGRVFIATTDGFVIALDANTGKEVWKQRQFEANELRNVNGPPRVFNGKVIIGHGGADISPIRGYVSAYDAMTGKLAWRFYTVPSDPSKPAESKADAVARPTWKGDWYGTDAKRVGGGGTAWNAFSYDPELNLIYIGVGNGFPYAQAKRSPGGGDNLFLASIVAVDANTGEYKWHYQVCPGEQWDCTATQDMTLATIEIDGKPRKVIMQAPKNGFFYVLDRKTGEFISAEKFAKVTWADRIDKKTGRPVENPGIRYTGKKQMFELWPGPQGAHSWLPQAYSPRTGLVYLPVIDDAAMIGDGELGGNAFTKNMGVALQPDLDIPGSLKGYLKAWDPVAQKARWTVKLPGAWPGGIMATGGDLVFQGRIDHSFVAYDARTGKEVWSFKTQAPVVAPPITYRVNGKQYVTVLTGNGSSGAGVQSAMVRGYDTDYRLPRHVLTFAIGGKDALPAYTETQPVPLQDPGFRPDPKQAEAGGMLFAMNGCMVCHGMMANPGGAAPDLRYSPMILDAAGFAQIVKGGALKPNGMPGYPQLQDRDLEALRHFLRIRAMQAPAEDAAVKAGKKPAGPRVQAVGGV